MGRKEEYKEKNLQYLQVLSTQEGICPLPCNMFYKVLQTGTGTVSPTIRSIVTVHYRGSLINGKEYKKIPSQSPSKISAPISAAALICRSSAFVS